MDNGPSKTPETPDVYTNFFTAVVSLILSGLTLYPGIAALVTHVAALCSTTAGHRFCTAGTPEHDTGWYWFVIVGYLGAGLLALGNGMFHMVVFIKGCATKGRV
jgi:hypothetical protein